MLFNSDYIEIIEEEIKDKPLEELQDIHDYIKGLKENDNKNNNEIPRKELMQALLDISNIVECYRFKLQLDSSDYDRYRVSKQTIKEIENIICDTLH